MAFPVTADGTLGKGRVFFDSTKSVGKERPGLPDGLRVDQDGNLFATGPGGVLVFNKEGMHLGTIATGVPTSNCGWGGDGSGPVRHRGQRPLPHSNKDPRRPVISRSDDSFAGGLRIKPQNAVALIPASRKGPGRR